MAVHLVKKVGLLYVLRRLLCYIGIHNYRGVRIRYDQWPDADTWVVNQWCSRCRLAMRDRRLIGGLLSVDTTPELREEGIRQMREHNRRKHDHAKSAGIPGEKSDKSCRAGVFNLCGNTPAKLCLCGCRLPVCKEYMRVPDHSRWGLAAHNWAKTED